MCIFFMEFITKYVIEEIWARNKISCTNQIIKKNTDFCYNAHFKFTYFFCHKLTNHNIFSQLTMIYWKIKSFIMNCLILVRINESYILYYLMKRNKFLFINPFQKNIQIFFFTKIVQNGFHLPVRTLQGGGTLMRWFDEICRQYS